MSLVKTKEYRDIIDRLKVGIDNLANQKGNEYFDKFCYILFRSKTKIPGQYQLERVNSFNTFCFDSIIPKGIFKKFNKQFISFYTKRVVKETNLLRLQKYDIDQLINIQFYDQFVKIDPINPFAKEFYANYNSEGLVFAKNKVIIIN